MTFGIKMSLVRGALEVLSPEVFLARVYNAIVRIVPQYGYVHLTTYLFYYLANVLESWSVNVPRSNEPYSGLGAQLLHTIQEYR